jgi:hypothetical protein
MITQAIKRWLRNMFAWWPWKYTPPETYKQANTVPPGMNTSQEGISRSAVEGSIAQASITPRLSTIEERPEHPILPQKPATNDLTGTPSSSSLKSPTDSAAEPGNSNAFPAPTPQQRLEFLRYLVERGIVNEGSEEK